MATELTMPKLSDTMTEGQLGKWRKQVGERIERGDIIAEVETDKAVMDLEAFTAGILLEQRIAAGQIVAVGTVIGLIGDTAELASTQPVSPSPPQPAGQPAAEKLPPVVEPKPSLKPVKLTTETAAAIQAAPIVRRRAAELGIDLSQVHGSGPQGRIVLDDLHVPRTAAAEAVPVPAAAVREQLPTTPQPLSRLRRAVARTTTSSWQTIPHFYLNKTIEMERAERLCHARRAEGSRISLNGVLLSAAAMALASHPTLNATFSDDAAVFYPQINLSFAVALDDGLQMPVVKRAESLTPEEVTHEAERLINLARNDALNLADITGGTFSLSNLGMYGIDSFHSLIMPGQAAILALGSITERPVVHNGQLAVARTMVASLACDHRLVDGAAAAAFLNDFKRILEGPDVLIG